jgi:hypothetical protein
MALREWNDAGNLNETQGLLFRQIRPSEELYDLNSDPFEIHNLEDDSKFAVKLLELRGRLDRWMKETDDKGRLSESRVMFESDMAVYTGSITRKGDLSQLKIIKDNIALMKKWASEGK